MNESINPATPKTDQEAFNLVWREIAKIANAGLAWSSVEGQDIASNILEDFAATFEHDVNANGVPVRRVVLRSTEWTVDPDPAPIRLQRGDIVKANPRYHSFKEFAEWEVSATPSRRINPAEDLIFVRQPGWGEGLYLSGKASCFEILSRPQTHTEAPR